MVDKLSPVRPVPNVLDQSRELYGKREKGAAGKSAAEGDRVSLDLAGAAQTYGKLAGVEVGSPYQLLKALVIKTLNEQGVASKISDGNVEIDLASLTPEAAAELVSDDGYFGVEKTSQRIVDFAIGAFGGDPAKLTQMKDAIEKGFREAADVFGGQLPEISHQTYAAAMDKLDAFAGVKAEG